MLAHYTERFHVHSGELNTRKELRSRSLLSYLDQATINGAADAGFDAMWYESHHAAWMVREVTLQWLGPAHYNDELVVTIWVSDVSRLRVTCQYEVRQKDGSPVAVARTERVYIDVKRSRPVPIEPELVAVLQGQVQAPSPLWPASDDEKQPASHQVQHELTRPVYYYENDALRHTNHAVYADWLEDAANQAVRSWGYELDDQEVGQGRWLSTQLLSMRYLGSALGGDSVEIITRAAKIGEQEEHILLTQEIRRGTELLLTATAQCRLLSSPLSDHKWPTYIAPGVMFTTLGVAD